jgi:hypothetical protein
MRLLAVLLLAVVACGSGHQIDHEAFRADLEALRGPMSDRRYREVVENTRDLCSENERVFAMTASISSERGMIQRLRLFVSHVCPDRTDELARALTR